MNIKEYIKEQRLITDGAMGTYYEEKYSEDTVIAEKENESMRELWKRFRQGSIAVSC